MLLHFQRELALSLRVQGFLIYLYQFGGLSWFSSFASVDWKEYYIFQELQLDANLEDANVSQIVNCYKAHFELKTVSPFTGDNKRNCGSSICLHYHPRSPWVHTRCTLEENIRSSVQRIPNAVQAIQGATEWCNSWNTPAEGVVGVYSYSIGFWKEPVVMTGRLQAGREKRKWNSRSIKAKRCVSKGKSQFPKGVSLEKVGATEF